jgi:L-ribulose-5-phosphate 4-epimerase
MLTDLREQVWMANLDLGSSGLVILTFGNVSGIDRRRGLVAIKPSGVSYKALKVEDIVLLDLDGKKVEGKLNPSSDTPAHLELYKAFAGIGGITHAHSKFASIFAQAAKEIPCLGTTHADYFNGPVPVTRFLKKKEVEEDYEASTGSVIAERFGRRINPIEMPAVLVAGHGPFCWGKTPGESVEVSLILEKAAQMALGSLLLSPNMKPLPKYILDKHFQRKHGPQAYYGQKKGARK